MKYFIDFEATQYTQEIISIGCIREDGKKFRSLIKPKQMKTVTKFITELTGITREMLENERNSDAVFEEFFDWIAIDNEPAEFYCYGGSDIDFLRKNLKDRTSSFKAQAALSTIAFNLTDYSINVKKHFGLMKAVALKKVMEYFYPTDEHICHDALSDAEMLYHIYVGVENEKQVKGIPFPDHVGIPVFKTAEDFAKFRIERYEGSVCKDVYETLEETVRCLVTLLKSRGNANVRPENISKKIIGAINNNKKYFGYKWVVKVRRD